MLSQWLHMQPHKILVDLYMWWKKMEFIIPVHRFRGNLVTETEDNVQALGSCIYVFNFIH